MEPAGSPGIGEACGRPDERIRGPGSRVIGRYRLAEQVDEAVDCTVWKAFDEMLWRPVAVRAFAPGSAGAGDVVAAAGAASRVDDVRFAHVFDAADGPEGAYVVTEWPLGECLEDLVADGPLEAAQAVWIVAEAARALAVAHAAGVEHLCLSPRTLRWSPEGGVKITGLGVDAALATSRRDDGVLADTQALAGLLYAALTTHWPGEAETTLTPAPTRRRVVYPPRQVRAGIPGGIDAIICRALLPGSRRGNPPITRPEQLADALPDTADQAAVSGRSHAGGDRPGAPWRPRVPRLRTAVLTGGALTLAAAVAILGGFVSGRTPTLNEDGVASPISLPSPAQASTPAKPPAQSPTRAPTERLTPLAARSFDPGGNTADSYGGAAPVQAGGDPPQVWRTHWYTTAHFGNLQAGTGLLLDMGRPVAVTDVQLTLGAVTGADLRVRIAATATSLGAFRTMAQARNAAGRTDLAITTPLPGRYVLIWFTRLPPSGSGNATFQASIHAIRLYGFRV